MGSNTVPGQQLIQSVQDLSKDFITLAGPFVKASFKDWLVANDLKSRELFASCIPEDKVDAIFEI